MSSVRDAILVALTMAVPTASAERLVLREGQSNILGGAAFGASLYILDANERRVTPIPMEVVTGHYEFSSVTMAVGSDGLLYVPNGESFIQKVQVAGGVLVDAPWSDVPANHIAFDSQGVLYASSRLQTHADPSALWRVDTSGMAMVVDAVAGHRFYCMDIPRSGPYEDGVVATVRSLTTWEWFLARYRRMPDRSLMADGLVPLDGPLASAPRTCDHGLFSTGLQTMTVRPRGTLLIADPCSNDILEYDTEGRFQRLFAHLDPDPTLFWLSPLNPNPTGIYPSTIQGLACTQDDRVVATMARRAYVIDPEGASISMIDYLFNGVTSVTPLEPHPFETAGRTCTPAGLGYWKRQCLGLDRGGPMYRARERGRTPPPGPGLHPSFRDGRLPSLEERVTADLAAFGTDACQALWPLTPSDWHAKALQRHAAVLFNWHDRRLHRRCPVEVRGVVREAGDVRAEVEALLALGTEDADRDAFHLANAILREFN